MNLLLVNPSGKKYCIGCEIKKDVVHFHISMQMSDGLTTLCRICYNSQQREKYKLKTQTRKKKKPKKKTKDIELEKILAPRTSFIRIIKPQPSKKEPLQFMHHQQYGKGLVVVDEGDTIKIKFADGIIRRIYREYLKETK